MPRWTRKCKRERAHGSAAQLKLLQQRLPDIFHRDEPTLTVGHVVERIVETVESEGIDLVIIGGRRRGLVSRLLGSTTEGLLLQAKASGPGAARRLAGLVLNRR